MNNGSFIPKVPGSVWIPSDGIYRLMECPAGHQLVNSIEGTSKGTFSQALQFCKPCLVGQYIVDPNMDVCVSCPSGTIFCISSDCTLWLSFIFH